MSQMFLPPEVPVKAVTPEAGHAPACLEEKWTALQHAALILAQFAGKGHAAANLTDSRIFEVSGMRAQMVERGVEDMIAMMEPGLTALLSIDRQGKTRDAAASALWEEYCNARAALFALLPVAVTRAA